MNGTVTPVVQPTVTVKPVIKTNGAAPPAATPPPAAPAIDFAAEQAKLKSGMEDLSKQSARIARESQKLSAERRALQKEIAESKKWAQEREAFRLNPESLLKGELGEDYYDKLTNMRLAGGAPPAALIQTEMQKLEAKIRADLEARDAKAKEAETQAATQRDDNARKVLQSDALAFAKDSAQSASPVVVAYGSPEAFAGSIAQRIETDFKKTGRLLSTQEAVDIVEKELFALVEKVTATSKWQQRSTKSGEVVPQQRRTLSNATTGRTPGREPPRSEEERRARAEAAFEAAHRKNAGQ